MWDMRREDEELKSDREEAEAGAVKRWGCHRRAEAAEAAEADETREAEGVWTLARALKSERE